MLRPFCFLLKSSLLLLSIGWLCISSLFAQISVEPAIVFTPEDLIENVFLGDGVEVTNINFNGSAQAVGLFNNGQNDIDIANGIIMSTGFARDAAKKNTTPDNGGSPPGAASDDPDLADIANEGLEDVVIYEITFIPTADTLRFRYVFASEEYPEWACSNFNDVFGFFISGPGINGPYTNNAENIALIPDPADPSGLTFTNLPVTINNVNDQGIDPAGGCFSDFSVYYNSIPNGNTPTFDGYLDVFTAQAIVQPCLPYTIKLAIADRGDPDYDTAVFLEAKSFGTGALQVETTTLSLDNSIAEGCADGAVTFSLPNVPMMDIPLDYTIFGTATNGVDYALIPSDTFIPAGQQSITIPIIAFEDGTTEPLESISFDVQRDICNRDTFTVFISDLQILPPSLRTDTSICQGEPVQLDGTLPINLPPPLIFNNDTDLPIATISNNEPPQPGQQPTISNINVSGVQPTELQEGMIKAVCIDIEHFWTADVDVFLFSPDGLFIELTTDNGGSGQNYTATCFTPLSTDTIHFGSQAPNTAAPFTGDWHPEGDWSYLYDSPKPLASNGTWQLFVKDDQTGIDGTLLNWSICFNPVYRLAYEWAPSAGLSCADCPDPMAMPDTTTTYVLTVTDTYGCQVQDSITIDVEPVLEAPQNLNCNTITNNSIEFSWDAVNSANGYEVNVDGQGWMPASPGPLSHLVNNLTLNDTVTIEVRAIGPCGGNSVLLTCNTPPCTPPGTMINTVTPASCLGVNDGFASFSAMGANPPFTFTINPGGQSNMTGNFTGLAAGDYQLEVLNAINCPARLNFTINAASGISGNPVIINDALCKDQASGLATFSMSNGQAPYDFMWSDSQVDSIAIALAAGTYTATITDAIGCQFIDSLVINEPDSLELSFSATPVSCNGANDGVASAMGAAGTAPYSYNWDSNTSNQMNSTAINLAGGTYTVTLTDDNGCQLVDSIMVPENTAILPTLDITNVSCFGGADGSVTADATGGAGNYSYQWNDPAMQNGATAINLSANAYEVTVTDVDGCTAIAPFVIDEPPPLLVQLSTTDLLCADSSNGSALLIVSGGTVPYTYFWSDSTTISDSIRIDLPAGDFAVTISDGNRCDTIINFTINAPPVIELTPIDALLGCTSGDSGTIAILAAGGTAPYSYQWDASANFSTNDTVFNLLPGTYLVTVSDANGCAAVDSAQVILASPVAIQTQTTDIACFGEQNGTATASISGGRPPYTLLWSNGDTSTSPINLSGGTYFLTVTDADGCPSIDSISILEPPPILIDVANDTISCTDVLDGELLINAEGGTPGYQYRLDSSFLSSQNTFLGLPPKTYTITVEDSNGCIERTTAVVADRPPFSVELGEDIVLQLGDSIQLFPVRSNGVGRLLYSWSPQDSTVRCVEPGPNCFAPWLVTQNTASFVVTAIDENGCIATDRITIFIEKDRQVHVPTGFTPNGDNVNDLLLVHGQRGNKVLVFRVYDRLGELLFEAKDFEVNDNMIGWDGNFRGEPMNPGVFVWYAEIEFIDGFRQLYKGNTTLLR